MRILNQENGKVIPQVEHKRNPLQKFMGLRFRKEGRALFSFSRPTRAPVDMLLVPRPLDIAFLDGDMKVLEIHGAHPVTLNPDTWRYYRPEVPYSYALEVEAGLLPYLDFDIGHSLSVEE